MLWVIVVTVGASIMMANLVFAGVYADRILPGVQVGKLQLGGLSRAQARQLLKDQTSKYTVNVQIGDAAIKVDPKRFGGSYDPETTLNQAFLIGRGQLFEVAGLWDSFNNGQIKLAYNLDRPKLQAYVSGLSAQYSVAPVDARIAVSAGKVSVEADKPGVAVDRAVLLDSIDASLASFASSPIVVSPATVPAAVQVKDTSSAVSAAKQIMALKVNLTYGDRTFKPTSSEIGSWIAFKADASQKVVPYIDTARVKGYLQSVAAAVDVPATNKKVDLINGVSKVVQEGKEGSAINQDGAVAAISSALDQKKPVEYALATRALPFKTVYTEVVSLEGGRYIEVNLSQQRLWLYDNYQVILESPLTSGASGAGFPTVTGLFAIYYKTTNTYLNGRPYGWDYNVHVDYWMPFYKGYGLHDASWRNGVFGGQDYVYNGSHGCVNLPLATAAYIYNWAAVGTPVWVHK